MHMKKRATHRLWAILLALGMISVLGAVPALAQEEPPLSPTTATHALLPDASQAAPDSLEATDAPTHADTQLPPGWLALPFALLLLMIATGPLLYEHFWHRHYPTIAVLLAAGVVAYYIGAMHNYDKPIEAVMEYIQFIALIAALYMASGGILIAINRVSTPATNVVLLLIGATLANLIGTTGASMLLIRPYIRLNRTRIQVYHVVFFIFMVSNVGGALTPIGDPPLFLGFLSGVPFFWTLQHNFVPWLLAISLLGAVFYLFDTHNAGTADDSTGVDQDKPAIQIVGQRNFLWLALIIGAVFIDPNIFDWVPALHLGHHKFSFVRELLLLGIAWASYHYADAEALEKNAFNTEPLREVVLLFIGIFGTMIPALELISAFAGSETGQALITHHTLYWGAGIFSSILDNAPTYLNFAAASMAAQGAHIAHVADVQAFAAGTIYPHSVIQLKAISVASVFFGAMTYIGNGPNFMVKAIAEDLGVQMPSFFGYMVRFSIPVLLPILALVWLLFFATV